jgi:hypothetical protein
MTTRTDIHSPTNMDPADYEYVFAYDSQGPGCLTGIMSTAEGQAWWSAIQANKANVHYHGQCDHCGAWLRYIAILKHTPTGQYIEVGETCLDNRFSLVSKAQFDTLRKSAALDRKAQRIRKAVVETLNVLSSSQPAEVVQFLSDREGTNDPKGIWYGASDIRRKFQTYGDISDRQAAAVAKALADVAERQAKRAAEATEPRVAAPEGRFEVTGTVLATKWQESDYGSVLKMLVKVDTDAGSWKCWGSAPSKLCVDKGDEVTFTAAFERSHDDESFAFFRRPTKAEIITTTEKGEAN